LPETRNGKTHKIKCGPVSLYVTVNTGVDGAPAEMFVKADNGWQGWADALAVTASMAMQHGCPLATILKKWRGMRFDPSGIGHGKSIPDAIAERILTDE